MLRAKSERGAIKNESLEFCQESLFSLQRTVLKKNLEALYCFVMFTSTYLDTFTRLLAFFIAIIWNTAFLLSFNSS